MRALLRIVLLVALPSVAAIGLMTWYIQGQRFVSTDNAYVKSNLVLVSSTVDGRVSEVKVRDDQSVRRGDVLFTLDARAHRIALARAQAGVERARHHIESLRAEHAQALAEIGQAREQVQYLERKLARERRLSGRGMSTASRLDEVEHEAKVAADRVRILRQHAARTLADLGGSAEVELEGHPRVAVALAERDAAALRLEDTVVRAPADGVVSRLKLQSGEWIEAGRTAFTLVEARVPWVEANLKETQLTHVRVGQPVRMHLDAYPELSLSGRVASISAATGSEFLVLPAQNATGNWVKVVQRLPVRIELTEPPAELLTQGPHRGAPEPAQASSGPGQGPALRSGMTVSVTIDTGRENDWSTLIREATASLGLDVAEGE